MREALDHHWAPKNEERGRALSEALGRIVAFLRKNVRAPLEAATGKGDTGPLRDAASRALGGLDDLEFYLVDPLTPDEVHNLTKVVEQVTREFTSDWDIAVRMRADAHPVRAHVHRDTFMDAVYLLLHNAAQFGEGKTVDVTIAIEDGRAAVRIRDQGAGFSKEALTRAQDLFYSTSSSGLGLGIPFARKIIESFGGGIDVRNADEGGARGDADAAHREIVSPVSVDVIEECVDDDSSDGYVEPHRVGPSREPGVGVEAAMTDQIEEP